MSIPTLVPRDLLPRPEWTALRVAVGTAIPTLVFFALIWKGVPPQFLLIVLLMIGSQVSVALAQAQKEMLAASTSFFHPGLGRRVGRAQLFWGFVLPAATIGLYWVLAADSGFAVLGSIYGLAMVLHAVMSWATLRLWWAFQLPAWLFYAFFMPMAIRKGAVAGHLVDAARYPAAWLAAGLVALALLVRFVSSRDLQRRLHDTIVLGPEAIFAPSRVQDYKQRSRRYARWSAGPVWRSRLLAALIGRAGTARDQGDVAGSRRWLLLAANAAVNVSPRRWVVPLLALAMLAATAALGYVRSDGSLGTHWFAGILYQFGLWPVFSLAVTLLASPLDGASRRTAWRAEAAAFLGAVALCALMALPVKIVSEAFARTLPSVTWFDGTLRAYVAAPLHGLWLVPLAAPFAWLAVALRPRPHCGLANMFVIAAFFVGHGLMTGLPYAQAVPPYAAASLLAFAVAFWLRRRWWLRADLPA